MTGFWDDNGISCGYRCRQITWIMASLLMTHELVSRHTTSSSLSLHRPDAVPVSNQALKDKIVSNLMKSEWLCRPCIGTTYTVALHM